MLEGVLALAADWRPGAAVRPVDQLMADPALARYVAGWPAEGDVGFVAEATAPLGATWWRFFTAQDHGYGFIEEAVPEVSIGVVAHARGQGIGTRLLDALVHEATVLELPALSLSVECDNPAAALYRRLGFEVVDTAAGAFTMRRSVGA